MARAFDDQLRFTGAEFLRGLEGLVEEDAQRRLAPAVTARPTVAEDARIG